MKKIYLVEKAITLSRYIEAKNSKEAETIAFDMGDIDARATVKDWHCVCRIMITALSGGSKQAMLKAIQKLPKLSVITY